MQQMWSDIVKPFGEGGNLPNPNRRGENGIVENKGTRSLTPSPLHPNPQKELYVYEVI